MATQYSDQMTNAFNTVPPVMARTQTLGGRVRALVFSAQTSATIGVQNDTLVLGDLPAGARVLFGYFRAGAMGASATFSIGNSTTAGKYLNASSVATAVEFTAFASTLATRFLSGATLLDGTVDSVTEGTTYPGQIASPKERVLGTFGGATWASTKTLEGVLLYVLD